ncbi:hypothetical protein [Enterococcus camelliae]|uniref:Uncharacterized protein n=1 Tax=Enterococcus camelliae TaxID=453959 RepID=A0ABW5TKV5_9ENTE
MKNMFHKGFIAAEGFISLFLLSVCLIPIFQLCSTWLEASKKEQAKIEMNCVLFEAVLTQSSQSSQYTIQLSKERASIYLGSDQVEVYQTDEWIHAD